MITAKRMRAGVALLLLSLPPRLALADEIGRLFYTPAQRAQLELARAHKTPPASPGTGTSASAPTVRYNGVLIRSDGKTTRWVDGTATLETPAVRGLKPGQIRADGKVYEPYQIVQPEPAPSPSPSKEPAP